MVFRTLFLSFLMTAACLGQGLPDRDELIAKFIQEDTSDAAARELVKHFQMGGLRSIIRNLNKLPFKKTLAYGESLRHLDLNRFRNDLNANVGSAKGVQTKAMFLMLLSTVGYQVDPTVFKAHAANEADPLFVRLAAGGGVITVQSPKLYDDFLAMADEAIVDPGTGQDDLRYALLTKKNLGFYLYSKGKLDDKETATHGAIVCSLAMVEAGDTEVYENLLDHKKRKYFPLMIDRAVKVGGVDLLETMLAHKAAKKFKSQINSGIGAARAVAEYREKFADKAKDLNMGPVLYAKSTGTGNAGYRAGYGVAKINVDGSVTLVTHQAPFGGSDDLSSLLTGTTFPAHNKRWEPVESYMLVFSP